MSFLRCIRIIRKWHPKIRFMNNIRRTKRFLLSNSRKQEDWLKWKRETNHGRNNEAFLVGNTLPVPQNPIAVAQKGRSLGHQRKNFEKGRRSEKKIGAFWFASLNERFQAQRSSLCQSRITRTLLDDVRLLWSKRGGGGGAREISKNRSMYIKLCSAPKGVNPGTELRRVIAPHRPQSQYADGNGYICCVTSKNRGTHIRSAPPMSSIADFIWVADFMYIPL